MKENKLYQIYVFDDYGKERKECQVFANSVVHAKKIAKGIRSYKISNIVEVRGV
jgi:hypothetical protein